MTTKKINIMLLSIIVIFSGQLQAVQTCESNITLVSPTDRFTINGDGTATDDQTGLMWMRCSLGQTWNNTDGACDDTTTSYNWQAALSAAENSSFATHTDWRLPNINELASITELACHNPAINDEIFPTTPSSFYWSSSPDVTYTTNSNIGTLVWVFSFQNSSENSHTKNSSSRVRLVRTGQ